MQTSTKRCSNIYVYEVFISTDPPRSLLSAVVIRFAETQYAVAEGASTMLLVERVGAIAYPISVNLTTIDGSAGMYCIGT